MGFLIVVFFSSGFANSFSRSANVEPIIEYPNEEYEYLPDVHWPFHKEVKTELKSTVTSCFCPEEIRNVKPGKQPIKQKRSQVIFMYCG